MIPTAEQLDALGWDNYFTKKVEEVEKDLLRRANRGDRDDCFTINPVYTKKMKAILKEKGYAVRITKGLDGVDYFRVYW